VRRLAVGREIENPPADMLDRSDRFDVEMMASRIVPDDPARGGDLHPARIDGRAALVAEPALQVGRRDAGQEYVEPAPRRIRGGLKEARTWLGPRGVVVVQHFVAECRDDVSDVRDQSRLVIPVRRRQIDRNSHILPLFPLGFPYADPASVGGSPADHFEDARRPRVDRDRDLGAEGKVVGAAQGLKDSADPAVVPRAIDRRPHHDRRIDVDRRAGLVAVLARLAVADIRAGRDGRRGVAPHVPVTALVIRHGACRVSVRPPESAVERKAHRLGLHVEDPAARAFGRPPGRVYEGVELPRVVLDGVANGGFDVDAEIADRAAGYVEDLEAEPGRRHRRQDDREELPVGGRG
jgi:hypothetical protein